jgi:acyl dehydratase
MSFQIRGKYYEELPVGAEFYTPARTVTEADVVAFACLTGDYNPGHTNRELAAKSAFGERIAHGLLTTAFVLGFLDKIGIIEGTAQAFLGLEMSFRRPVLFDDTISAKLKVVEARLSSRPGAGIVKFAVSVTNQKDEEVSEGRLDMMMSTKSSS